MIDVALLGIIRRWYIRDRISIREIARRLDISRNTVRRYIRTEVSEPSYPTRHSPSLLDSFAPRLSAWLSAEAVKSRKQRRTLKQMFLDLRELGYEGSYDRVAAFSRQWKVGQIERVKSASKSTQAVTGQCKILNRQDRYHQYRSRGCKDRREDMWREPAQYQQDHHSDKNETASQNGGCARNIQFILIDTDHILLQSHDRNFFLRHSRSGREVLIPEGIRWIKPRCTHERIFFFPRRLSSSTSAGQRGSGAHFIAT
ncbi:winged helix-turn-helix domain-containing protein [Herbaspirillum sp. C9C3]|nr:winged helix-turn-helix domain-containing protein [Herbaspirillum sp. C9C3]